MSDEEGSSSRPAQPGPTRPPKKPLPPPSDVPYVVITKGIGGGTKTKRLPMYDTDAKQPWPHRFHAWVRRRIGRSPEAVRLRDGSIRMAVELEDSSRAKLSRLATAVGATEEALASLLLTRAIEEAKPPDGQE